MKSSKKSPLFCRYDNFCRPHNALVIMTAGISLPEYRVDTTASTRHLVQPRRRSGACTELAAIIPMTHPNAVPVRDDGMFVQLESI